jgi:hypothetical protein
MADLPKMLRYHAEDLPNDDTEGVVSADGEWVTHAAAVAYAAEVSAADNFLLLGLIADIRAAAEDKEGRHMWPELVAHIAGLREDAGRYRWLRNVPGIQTFICGFAGHSRISGIHADVEIDAAMADQPEEPKA